MTMQYNVKSQYVNASGVALPFRTRIKSIVSQCPASATGTIVIVDNTSISGTYARSTTTATVTATNHGLAVGDWVYLDWDLTDGAYQVVTAADANTFTVTVADSGGASGNVTVYNDVLYMQTATLANTTNILLPGEGILAATGVRVFLPSTILLTIIYG